MNRLAVLNVVGLSPSLLGPHTPRINAFLASRRLSTFQPEFPALTCSAQATYLTGLHPAQHGIVGNGWYHRELSEVQFWKQSNALVHGEKLWETLRRTVQPDFSCAKLFWWFNMYSSANWSITPRPMYPADGRKVFDVYTQPMPLRESIKHDLGEFPFPAFWGPKAGLPSSQWIAQSARWIEEKYQPHLHLVYLPHLDYCLQKFGPDHASIPQELAAIDALVGDLIDFLLAHQVEPVVLSEYGISKVTQPIHLNRLFRQQGWITIKKELGLELLDAGASAAFAVADHQVAHVYVKDPKQLSQVRDFLENLDGVESVFAPLESWPSGPGVQRAGDLIVTAQAHAWFTYYYWLDDQVAPDFARCIDIHRKPGYDPAELWLDPTLRFPLLKIAAFLAKKKLGLRGLMEVIPLDASLVGGSHGRSHVSEGERALFIGPAHLPEIHSPQEVHRALLAHFSL